MNGGGIRTSLCTVREVLRGLGMIWEQLRARGGTGGDRIVCLGLRYILEARGDPEPQTESIFFDVRPICFISARSPNRIECLSVFLHLWRLDKASPTRYGDGGHCSDSPLRKGLSRSILLNRARGVSCVSGKLMPRSCDDLPDARFKLTFQGLIWSP